ncbi:hypothetical protein ACRAWD_18550 [Caulobacter segnis]
MAIGANRPPTFTVNPDGCYSIGLNVDRDHVTIVLLDLAGQVRARATREVAFASPEEVAAFFEATRQGVPQKLKGVQADRIIGVGVAADDLAETDLPHRPPPTKPGTPSTCVACSTTPMVGRSPSRTTPPPPPWASCTGHGVRDRSFFYMLVEFRPGRGLVIDGEYFRGAHGRSGELGFLPMDPSGEATLEDFFRCRRCMRRWASWPPSDPAR